MSGDDSHFDVIVIGGGAAGLMCAFTAGQNGRRVLVLEHQERIGKKITISGGGRCNFTNLGATAANYLSERPDFCKSALARYTPWDFVALVEKHGIAYHEKKLGQQFCDGSSQQIIDLLLKECADANVQIRCNTRVVTVEKLDRFHVHTHDALFTSNALVIATGGLSFPKLGATDFGYKLATRFGLQITALRPGLVPLTFTPRDHPLHDLSGVSLPVVTRFENMQFPDDMLFTHRGLSGPAILQISSYWREGQPIAIDLLPKSADPFAPHRQTGKQLFAALSELLPKRLAEAWTKRNATDKSIAHFKNQELEALTKLLHEWSFQPAGTEGYPKAEVTVGGVDTAELSSKTMESRKVPGLFFIGECVDVTGWLGGYNFQWAWASGNAAGKVV